MVITILFIAERRKMERAIAGAWMFMLKHFKIVFLIGIFYERLLVIKFKLSNLQNVLNKIP